MNYEDYDFFGEDFEDQLLRRIEYLQTNHSDIAITLTGNAFVDAGLYAVAILSGRDLFELTVGDILDTILNIDGLNSNGKAFARRNARIKTTSKVLFNNPLNQPAYGSTSKRKKGLYRASSKAEPSPLQERIYRAYLLEFLSSYSNDQSKEGIETQCMLCGQFTDLDFNDLETTFKTLIKQDPLDKKDAFGSGPTRTWIPLLGTTSSIQALPGFAEPNIICGKCIVLAQFLPQVVDLQNGLLTLYQSSNHRFAMEFYRTNLDNFEEMHRNTPSDEKLDIIGSDSWDYYISNLLRIITQYKEDLQHTNLILWKFDNYGTDPTLEYIQLPNRTLRFLHEVIVNYRAEPIIKNFIRFEDKNKISYSRRLFNCIEAQRDYFLFYPHTKYQIDQHLELGDWQAFFELYQNYILNWSPSALATAKTISEFVKDQTEGNEDDLLRVLKARDYRDLRQYLIPHVLHALDEGIVSTKELLILFETHKKYQENHNPWKLFRFYLHPSMDIKETTLQTEDQELDLDENQQKYLGIIQEVASYNIERREDRSSFDIEKYIDRLSAYWFNQFQQDYVLAGLENPYLTWELFEDLKLHFYRHEILFYFRIFSIEPVEILSVPKKPPTEQRLIQQSGLSPVLADILVKYISGRLDSRIRDLKRQRVFRELDADLKYNNYSSKQFFYLLLDSTEEDENSDFDEYHYFTYELEYQGRKQRVSGSQKRKPDFSWRRFRDKLRLFIAQYRQVRQPTLEQQIQEETQ